MHDDICDSFCSIVKKLSKLGETTHFVACFQRFFDHALLHPLSDTPIFEQVKDLIEIHNPGKFHQYSICGCQVT